MELTKTLKTLPLMGILAFSLGLSPSIAVADNSDRGNYKKQHSRDANRQHNNGRYRADKPKHIKQQRRQEKKHRNSAHHNEYANRRQQRNHDSHNSHRNHEHGYQQNHHKQRKHHRKQHRHHNGHKYYSHQHYGRDYGHRHSSHSIAEYITNDHDRRYYLNLSNQRFMFGLHTGNVDIILGH